MNIIDKARQGDILFVKTNKSSFNKCFLPIQSDTLTVALGEVSGHHHTMFGLGDGTVTHLKDESVDQSAYENPNNIEAMFFEVEGNSAVVTHQEHNPVELSETGEDEMWVRIIQVEYDPFEDTLRRVMD